MCVATGALAAGADHLLAGAQLFRERRFQEAYVEFTVAARLGAGGDAAWYAAATLVKLQRPDDALEAFAAAERAAPSVADPLLDYYRALACYDARLFLCADRLLEGVGDRTGPRIGARSEEHTSELQSHHDLVCRLLLEKKKNTNSTPWLCQKKKKKKKKKK